MNKNNKTKNNYLDTDLLKLVNFAKTHYPQYTDSMTALLKYFQRAVQHSEIADFQHEQRLRSLENKIIALSNKIEKGIASND